MMRQMLFDMLSDNFLWKTFFDCGKSVRFGPFFELNGFFLFPDLSPNQIHQTVNRAKFFLQVFLR
jgi:hypothetical protein